MKSHFLHTALIAGLTLFGSLSLNAQSKLTATVPFSFVANHTAWPAGDYTVDETSVDGIGRFQITEKSSGRSSFVLAPILNDKKDYEEGHLTFACSNGDCVLAKVAMPESGTSYSRPDSSVQKDMQRKLDMVAMVNIGLHK